MKIVSNPGQIVSMPAASSTQGTQSTQKAEVYTGDTLVRTAGARHAAQAPNLLLPANDTHEPRQKPGGDDGMTGEAIQYAKIARDRQQAEDVSFVALLRLVSRHNADNRVRDKIRDDPGFISRLTPEQKGELIRALGFSEGALDHWAQHGGGERERVLEKEEDLILTILQSAGDRREYTRSVDAAGGPRAVSSMLDGRQQAAYERLNERYGKSDWNSIIYNDDAPLESVWSLLP